MQVSGGGGLKGEMSGKQSLTRKKEKKCFSVLREIPLHNYSRTFLSLLDICGWLSLVARAT